MQDLAIVVVGYNRPRSLSRLLGSLDRVAFDGQRVPLIISLDRSGNEEVVRVAEDFAWRHGDKTVRTYPERLGLKRHILACGDLTKEHEHLIVLEDDLYASPNLFRFATQAIGFYRDEDRVAGIALYSHLWKEGCHRPFVPLDDPFDAYFLQYACSWGQVWSREKWRRFTAWLEEQPGEIRPDPAIPPNVVLWSEQSWLKHHIRYCIATGRFFVHPRTGLTTNFSDQGQHSGGWETGYQVPLQQGQARTYRFPTLDESGARYDAFFECLDLAPALGVAPGELCVDLYGTKQNRAKARYWLTLEAAPHPVLKSFDLALRPHEANVLHGIPGDAIRLYDTAATAEPPRLTALTRDLRLKYDLRNLSYKALFGYSLRTGLRQLKAKFTSKR